MPASRDPLDLVNETPSERHARMLIENDLDLLWDLVDARKKRDMTQQDVADLLGVAQATIAAFERQDNDPKLSTIRRYAYAVGAVIHHVVERDYDAADAVARKYVELLPHTSAVLAGRFNNGKLRQTPSRQLATYRSVRKAVA